MAHGGGGRLMRALVEKMFMAAFRNPFLEARHDGAVLPRPFKKVVVNIGAPLSAGMLDGLRRRPASPDVYGDMSHRIMHEIAALRPLVLERYFGAERAAKVLLEEGQLAQALVSVDEAARKSDVFVEPPGTTDEAKKESLYREPSSSPMSGVGVTS